MTEVRATAMATKISTELGISRTAAFDAVLSVALELEITGTRYSEKQASEIELIVIRDAKAGELPTFQRRAIGE